MERVVESFDTSLFQCHVFVEAALRAGIPEFDAFGTVRSRALLRRLGYELVRRYRPKLRRPVDEALNDPETREPDRLGDVRGRSTSSARYSLAENRR